MLRHTYVNYPTVGQFWNNALSRQRNGNHTNQCRFAASGKRLIPCYTCIAYILCRQMLHDSACRTAIPSARPAASSGTIQIQTWSPPDLATPRLSCGGNHWQKQDHDCFGKILHYIHKYFTLPKLPHTPNVCDSFTKGLKRNIWLQGTG